MTRERAFRAVSLMRREGVSLDLAAQMAGVSPVMVHVYAGAALEKVGGRYVALPTDTLERVMGFVTPTEMETIVLRSSEAASAVGTYFNAVRRFVNTGDASRLAEFTGRSVTDADGKKWPFVTDPRVLKRLGNAGVLSFADLYRKVA